MGEGRWIETIAHRPTSIARGVKQLMAVNTTTTTPTTLDTVREAAGGRLDRAKTFLTEVRNELKRVTWPSQKEVYATTVVVILVSIFFGVYLFVLDYGLNSIVQWIFRRFGG